MAIQSQALKVLMFATQAQVITQQSPYQHDFRGYL